MTSDELKKYIEEQKAKLRKYKAVWRAKNKEKVRRYNAEYQRNKRARKKK